MTGLKVWGYGERLGSDDINNNFANLIVRGNVSLNIAAVAKGAVAATAHITFPAGRFSSNPKVFFQINSSYRAAFLNPVILAGGDGTSIDVTVYATDTMTAATLNMDWMAVDA